MSSGLAFAAPEQQLAVSAGVHLHNDAVLANIKRFTERYRGDETFRALLEDDDALPATLLQFHLEISPEDARSYLAAERGHTSGLTENLQRYSAFLVDAAKTDRLAALASSGSSERYTAWRKRQLGALRFRFSALSDSIARPAVAYELSRGCSVGCWFCAVGAEKLQSHFTATEANLNFFRATLLAMRDVLGDAAGAGMCYWATDPLDNPDYERFAALFAEENGVYPPTTTALAAKDPARMRALLETSAAHGTLLNRFSVLSLGMMNRIHGAFSAEDLLATDLVFQMPRALVAIGPTSTVPARKIRAGKARALAPGDERVYTGDAGTVACVIGFLFNLVDRTLKLIVPCIPSDADPLGYHVLDSVSGFDTENIATHLHQLVDRHMHADFGDAALALHPSLSIEPRNGTLTISSSRHSVTIPANVPDAVLARFLSLLRTGSHSAAHVLETMRLQGMGLLQTQTLLERLRAEGVFEP